MIRGDPHAVSIEQLSSCSFIDAFHMWVLNDSDVIAASKQIENFEKHKSVFEEGQLPGPIICYRWPLEMTAESFAYDFIRPISCFIDAQLPRPSEAIRYVSEKIVDRWQRLRRRLIEGDLIAQGTFARTGIVQTIDPMQWRRTNLSVDLQNGDLLGKENSKLVALWTGLMVGAGRQLQHDGGAHQTDNFIQVDFPNSKFHGEPQPHYEPRPFTTESHHHNRRRATPRLDEVAEALIGLNVDHLVKARQWKQIASLIAPKMRKPPTSAKDSESLTRAVKRYYERQNTRSS